MGKYLCAELGGGNIIAANRTSASGWETFRVTNFFILLLEILLFKYTSAKNMALIKFLTRLIIIFLQLWRINEKIFQLRVLNKQFVGLDTTGNGINIVAVSNTTGRTETFEIVRRSGDLKRIRIKASNGFYLQVTTFSFPFSLLTMIVYYLYKDQWTIFPQIYVVSIMQLKNTCVYGYACAYW